MYNTTEILRNIVENIEDYTLNLPVYRESNKVPEHTEYVFVDQVDRVDSPSTQGFHFELLSFDITIHLDDTRDDLETVARAIEHSLYYPLYHLEISGENGSVYFKPISYQSHITDNIYHILVDYRLRVMDVIDDVDLMEEETNTISIIF